MNTSWKLAAVLLLALLASAPGCGRKPKEPADADTLPAVKLKEERPAPPATHKPPTPKAPEQPEPKAPAVKPVEVQFTGDDFADVSVGDGVSLLATCAGWEQGRVLLTAALRHTGKRSSATAPELYAAYTSDARAADKLYQHKGVPVRGVVVEKARGRLYLSPTEEPKAIKSDGKPDLAKLKPDFTLTAKQFREEVVPDLPPKEGEVTPRQKFGGKVVEVSGTVRRFISERGRAWVRLLAWEDRFSGPKEVQCCTRDDEPWGKVVPGQKVTLRGVAPLALGNPVLMDSVIVGFEPMKATMTPATYLAEEYKASRNATNTKYGGKLIYVSGEVSGVTVDHAGGVRVSLKTAPGLPAVVLEFGAANEDYRASSLPKGTKVKACCECLSNYDPAEMKLINPVFIFE
jgi:hypothetical protein